MKQFLKKLIGVKEIKNDELRIKNKEKEEKKLDNDKQIVNNQDIEVEDGWANSDYEEEEGQLSIDVYQTPKDLVIKSTIAGIQAENIDISIDNDMLTIRGTREEKGNVQDQDYLYRECYWGSFSRSIILPVEVKANKVSAVLENGILTITLPKAKISKEVLIKVKEQ